MIHIAVEDVAGVTAPAGRIVAMAESDAALTQRGDRVVTVDPSTNAWDADAQPGWFWTGSAVEQVAEMTDLERLKSAFRSLHVQLHGWADGLDALSRGQLAEVVSAGHDWLYWAHGAAYLIGRDSTTYTIAQRIAWAGSMATGAADITSPAAFYASAAGRVAPTGPKTWVNPETGAKVNLDSAIDVSGTVPTSADLSGGAWIEALTG